MTVWEFLDHIILAYSLLFTAAKLRNFPEITNDFGEILYLGCKAAIKRAQRELAHFVEREQARTSFKSEYSLATSGMQGQAYLEMMFQHP